MVFWWPSLRSDHFLSRLLILCQEKELHLGPLQWHSRLEARETVAEAALISLEFSFFLSGRKVVLEAHRTTMSSAYCSQNAVSEPLPSPPPPPRASQTSSRPPTMCWPCVVKLPVPSTSAAWQQLGPISNRLQKPRCPSAPLHLELEIALVFPCIIKSRTGVDVGNCLFFFFLDTKQFFF